MKILIIEDELAIRETLQDMLELNGHTVIAAADGPTGAARAAEGPDLILCDIGLPGFDGYQVLTAVRQLPEGREVPFIFLTARADRSDQRRGMALGADDYITKPFTQRDILDAIAARVQRQKPLRERVKQLVVERRSEVSANWSHELMTPLNGVLGGLELIESEADTIQPGELKQLLALIRGGAERQHTLSRKLVLYFELEQAKAAPPLARPLRCDMTAIMTGANRAAEAAKRTADLTVRCDPGVVLLAEAYLVSAIAEVVGNAFRFSTPGQPVVVTGAHRGARYMIEISDQGPGMTAEERAGFGAFVQFGRVHREQQGLGLGLAIARSAAESGGGGLSLAEGAGGRGLRVIFDLPTA